MRVFSYIRDAKKNQDFTLNLPCSLVFSVSKQNTKLLLTKIPNTYTQREWGKIVTWRSVGVGGRGGSDSERERRLPRRVQSEGAAASGPALEEDDTVRRRKSIGERWRWRWRWRSDCSHGRPLSDAAESESEGESYLRSHLFQTIQCSCWRF